MRTLSYLEQSSDTGSSSFDTYKTEGYQSQEPVKGYLTRDDTVKGIFPNNEFLIERRGFYGQCERERALLFMEDVKTEECGVAESLPTQDFCQNKISPEKNAYNFAISMNGTDFSSLTKIYLGTQRKFSLNNNHTELALSDDQKSTFLSSTFDPANCQCDNLLLESHYTVYYSDVGETQNTSFKIDNITIDLVYGQLTPTGGCDTKIALSRKSSWTFKQRIFSRKNSGGPGYIKGNKVLTGATVVGENNTYVNMSTEPFKLRGADNQGTCYFIKQSLSNAQNVTDYKIEKPSEDLYYDDPELLFADSTIYGCRLSLTRQELRDFCENKKWQNLMLFQNLQQLDVIGRFGNADPHLIKDWTEAIFDSDKAAGETFIWDNAAGTCTFPSSYVLKIFYSKINTKRNPQYQIIRVQHQAEQYVGNAWTFKKSNFTTKQDFSAILSVQFYETEQTPTLYTPKTPNPLKPLPRNILYPFYVYGGASFTQILSSIAMVCAVAGILI
ncbi:hypothetical protein FGO68_gene15939 [Halteria grandinella]|uniref:Tectonic domain-containing protein n=1 Tax=Halteria grandinella TaxID=5974 RepID=A0A8J8NTN3_HALGN|nr:hypothetical protein FGO68_gene15939 [Halteria grandinella]